MLWIFCCIIYLFILLLKSEEREICVLILVFLFLGTGNLIRVSFVYYLSNTSLPMAKPSNASMVSFWPWDLFSVSWLLFHYDNLVYGFTGFAKWHAGLPWCTRSIHSKCSMLWLWWYWYFYLCILLITNMLFMDVLWCSSHIIPKETWVIVIYG